MTRIDLITLSLFIAVAEETSLAKAAEREHLAASAISKRLADLELNFNIRLFDRRPNGMLLTSAGSAFLHHARLIMRNVAELEAELQDFSNGLRGAIRVQANATAMARYLPEDIKSFLALYPEVRIELEESTTSETLRAIAENAVDIGIYGDVIVPAELTSLVYRRDRLALLVPLDHPLAERKGVAFADTVAYAYIGAPKGSSIDTALIRAAGDLGVSLRMNTRTSGFDAISCMVAADLGIAIVPHSVAVSYAEALNVKVLDLEEPWAERKLMVCVRNIDALTPAAAAFLAHLTRRGG